MPGKNKPKRLDRNRAWRVARRKKKRSNLVKGNSRNRKKREKKKNIAVKVAARNSVPSKLGANVPSSSGKKIKKVVKKVDKK